MKKLNFAPPAWLVTIPAVAGLGLVTTARILGISELRHVGVLQVLSTDTPSLVFLGFIAFLGFHVYRFSIRNLAGDQNRGRFLGNLLATLWAVEGLAISGNFLFFMTFWILTSAGLHQLLEHFRDRPGAVIVAREKFIISRIGDIALVSAGIILQLRHGTLNFEQLKQAMGAELDETTLVAAVLIVVGALTKSAQVPFHAWLPRTLEAPTSVSALMHAGIINAGGYLLIRFAFILEHSEAALTLVLVTGTVSAIWGGLTTLLQADIKRRLAWSTVGQMGFMMMEIGLGAPGLALVHLLGHGLYKARAFLWSGELSGASGMQVASHAPLLASLRGLVAWAAVSTAVLTASQILAPHHFLLTLIAVATLIPLFYRGHSGAQWQAALVATVGGLLVGSATMFLGVWSHVWFGLPDTPPEHGIRLWAAWASAAGMTSLGFLIVFHKQLAGRRWYQRLYAAGLHGFAFGRWPEAIADRFQLSHHLKTGAQK